MTIFASSAHGCVYQLVKDHDSDGDYLISTPMLSDGSYDTNRDHWDVVDMIEDQDIEHVNYVYQILQEEEIGRNTYRQGGG